MFRSLFGVDTSPGNDDTTYLRHRLRMFVQVMLAVDLLAYVSDFAMPHLVADLEPTTYPTTTLIVRLISTGIVVGGWLLTRFTRPPRGVLIGLETAVTLGLTLVYVHVALVQVDDTVADFAPAFTMFGIILLLGVRAALVPSPVLRTVLIGAASMGLLFVFARDRIGALDPRIFDGLVFIAGAYVLATAVTSHVIYGLRREVRAARRLGQYTLEETIGEGGMGTVHRARHALLKRQAAIKLIRNASKDPLARARFEREADATASLRSPHTVELYDFGVSTEGDFYTVMELLEGIDLETAVARFGPMPAARVVFLLRQACESLEEAHAAGLVHRDVKPANLVLCRYGLRHDFLKVLDFGLVTLGTHRLDAKSTADGAIAGTPAYLPPEVALGATDVDGRADLYALGCVAFWLLTAHVVFERDNVTATVLAHVNDRPDAPSLRSELEIPSALDAVVLACLEKDPDRRPASAGELSERLAAAVDTSAWTQERAAAWWDLHRPQPIASVAIAPTTRRLTKLFG